MKNHYLDNYMYDQLYSYDRYRIKQKKMIYDAKPCRKEPKVEEEYDSIGLTTVEDELNAIYDRIPQSFRDSIHRFRAYIDDLLYTIGGQPLKPWIPIFERWIYTLENPPTHMKLIISDADNSEKRLFYFDKEGNECVNLFGLLMVSLADKPLPKFEYVLQYDTMHPKRYYAFRRIGQSPDTWNYILSAAYNITMTDSLIRQLQTIANKGGATPFAMAAIFRYMKAKLEVHIEDGHS